jgi:hypothetical protein
MIVIGVDPGLTGALSAICTRDGLLECLDLPTCGNGTSTGSMKRWINVRALDVELDTMAWRQEFVRESVHAFIERPIPMPTLPAQTIASQFDTFGAVRALLESKSWGMELSYVNPREWKAMFNLGNSKEAARKTCQALYPEAPVSRVKDHNRAEAILIAHYGMRSIA